MTPGGRESGPIGRPEPPLPPLDLAIRVGRSEGDAYDYYLGTGRDTRRVIAALLPENWTFAGKRILDFGCGAGRTLRHFLDEAPEAELWGCDIHADSVEWVRANLSPPVRVFRNELSPPLEVADSSFDLIWAMSVFTHITDEWSGWLLEMHRILAPGGLLIASFLGAGIYEAMLGEPYREDAVGMLVQQSWEDPEEGGPSVFHSEWWLREHWGRAFELGKVRRPPRREDGSTVVGHSHLIARRRDVAPSREELERIEPCDGREVAALATNVRMLRRELDGNRGGGARARARAALRRRVLRSPIGPPALRARRRLRGRGAA